MKLIKSKRMWVTGLLTSGWIIDALQSTKAIRDSIEGAFIGYLPEHAGIAVAIVSFVLMGWTKYHDDNETENK